MLCRTVPIRTAARLCTASSRTFAPKCTAARVSTAAKQPKCSIPQQFSLLFRGSRCLRTSRQTRIVTHRSHFLARQSSTAAPGAGMPSSGVPELDSPLTWNRFLALRKQRRRISLISSMVCAVVCLAGGVVIIASQDIEAFGAQIYGFDTIFVLGLSTLAFGVVGWLIGPFMGNAVFNTWHRKLRQQIAAVSNFSASQN